MSWTKLQIKEKIKYSQGWLERAILAIYKRQTADEQRAEDTRYKNHIGFNAADAHYLTYCAKWLLKGKHLSEHHIEKARSRVIKYCGQLVQIANIGGK